MKEQKLTDKEFRKLFIRYRKENKTFDDLCDARDAVVSVMGVYSISLDALKIELKKWDIKIDKAFGKLVNKERKKSKRSTK